MRCRPCSPWKEKSDSAIISRHRFPSSRGQENTDACYDRRPHDTHTIIVSTTAPTPELLNHVGHALLRSVATGQGDPLRHAADALERLDKLLPNASSEARLIAVLLAVTDDATSQPVVASPAPQPTSQSQPARRTSKAARPTRKPKPATPRMDASGKLISSKEIGGVAVISQAEARKVLGMSCIQMLKLENQKLLARVQEAGSRLVFYSVAEVQHLLDKLDATPPPPL